MSRTKVPSHCVPCDCDCRQNIISMYHFENVIWNSFIQIWKTFRWPKSSKSRFGGGRNAQYAGWGWIALIPARQDHSQCYWGARRREAETAGSIRHEVDTLRVASVTCVRSCLSQDAVSPCVFGSGSTRRRTCRANSLLVSRRAVCELRHAAHTLDTRRWLVTNRHRQPWRPPPARNWE